MTKNATQTSPLVGIAMPPALITASRIKAASSARTVTIVSVGNSLTATPTKKNEPPHSTDKPSSMAHSSDDMGLFTGDGAVI